VDGRRHDIRRGALAEVPELSVGGGAVGSEDGREGAELEPAQQQQVVVRVVVLPRGTEEPSDVLRPVWVSRGLEVQAVRHLAPQIVPSGRVHRGAEHIGS